MPGIGSWAGLRDDRKLLAEWDDEVVSAFFTELEKFGTVLMGRKTYEVGLKEGKSSPCPSMRQVVFSRTMDESPHGAVELVRGNILDFARGIKAEADAPIWLCGGAEIASSLMRAGLIDHLVVKLNPIVFGSGIPLFGDSLGTARLKLTATKAYDCGIVVLSYDIVRRNDAA